MARPRLKSNTGLPTRWRHKNGAYRYQVPRGHEARWDGKHEFTLGRTLQEAYKVWAERIGEPAKVTTVAQLLERYLLEVTPTKKPRTQIADRYNIPTLTKRFGHFTVQPGSLGVEPTHVYQYVSKNTHRLTTAHREVEILSHAFTWAVQWGLIKAHPFKEQVRFERALQPKRKERYVEDWEIIEALSLPAMRKRGSVRMLQAYIRLKLLTGLRQTDLLRLRTSDDLPEEGIRVTPSKTAGSTGHSQLFKWTPERRQAWDAALATRPLDIAPYIFCTADGECYVKDDATASSFASIWQRFMDRVLKETKLKTRFAERDLRAKVGSDAETLERARRILGHADARTTLTFYRRKAEVIE